MGLIKRLTQFEMILRQCRRILVEGVKCTISFTMLVLSVIWAVQVDYMLYIQDNLPVVTVIIKKMFFVTFG